MIADDDIGDGGNRQIGHQQKRIIQILLPPHPFPQAASSTRHVVVLVFPWYSLVFVAFSGTRVRSGPGALPIGARMGSKRSLFHAFSRRKVVCPTFGLFSGVTLLGTGRGVEAWRKGDDVLPQTSLFLPAAGGTGSWMDSAGRRACRRHRDEFKVPWKFESWGFYSYFMFGPCFFFGPCFSLSLSPPPACLILSLFLSRPVSGRTS